MSARSSKSKAEYFRSDPLSALLKYDMGAKLSEDGEGGCARSAPMPPLSDWERDAPPAASTNRAKGLLKSGYLSIGPDASACLIDRKAVSASFGRGPLFHGESFLVSLCRGDILLAKFGTRPRKKLKRPMVCINSTIDVGGGIAFMAAILSIAGEMPWLSTL